MVLNNYEQVGWVLNLRAQWVQRSAVMPTPGLRVREERGSNKERTQAQRKGHLKKY